MISAIQVFDRYAEHCPHRIGMPVIRRPANALNVEIGAPADRCKLKPPAGWGDRSPGVTRWIASGGDPTVLGRCSMHCPCGARCSDCGHPKGDHDPNRGCVVGGALGGCSCVKGLTTDALP